MLQGCNIPVGWALSVSAQRIHCSLAFAFNIPVLRQI